MFGTSVFLSGSLLNFWSYGFAPQSVLAALESVQFVTNILFGKFMLGVSGRNPATPTTSYKHARARCACMRVSTHRTHPPHNTSVNPRCVNPRCVTTSLPRTYAQETITGRMYMGTVLCIAGTVLVVVVMAAIAKAVTEPPTSSDLINLYGNFAYIGYLIIIVIGGVLIQMTHLRYQVRTQRTASLFPRSHPAPVR